MLRLLPPYHRNFGKRLVKTPKLYFLDTGLLCYLLGIREPQALATHAQRGAIFETLVVSEVLKRRFNAGQPADLYFWRDNLGHEVDLLFEVGDRLQAIEIKSGTTFAGDWPDALRRWNKVAGAAASCPGSSTVVWIPTPGRTARSGPGGVWGRGKWLPRLQVPALSRMAGHCGMACGPKRDYGEAAMSRHERLRTRWT